MSRPLDPVPARPRPQSFRHRLLFTLGPALALALALLGGLVWALTYGWLTFNAQAALDDEIEEIATIILTPQGLFQPDAYHWNEPHHLYYAPHIDPYFVQIFDPEGQPLRASANIEQWAPTTYPTSQRPPSPATRRLFPRLQTFTVAGATLYYRAQPLHDAQGAVRGSIQVARYEPGIPVFMRRMALWLGGGLVPVWLALLGLTGWTARRVVAPLEAITAEAQAISPRRLDQRISVPAHADRETTELALTLNLLLAQLEASFEEVRRFTADAAHELQTPLTVLLGHVELGLRRERSPEAYRETLQVLRAELDGLIHMVRSLLQLARLDRDAPQLPTEPVDLSAIVEQVLPAHRLQAEAKGLRLEADLAAPAWAQAHPDLLRDVVHNLLDNAMKYTDEGHVHAAVQSVAEGVVFTVTDTGEGMPEAVRRHATDRFFRAPSVGGGHSPGHGLGLALVAQIVAWHGGTVTFTPGPEAGTTATVYLPATPQAKG